MTLLLLLLAIWFVSSVFVCTFFKLSGIWDSATFFEFDIVMALVFAPLVAAVIIAGLLIWNLFVMPVLFVSNWLTALVLKRKRASGDADEQSEATSKSASPDPSVDQSSSAGKVVMDK